MKNIVLSLLIFCMVGTAQAAITTQLDSDNFDYKFEGDTAIPAGYTPANSASGSSDGDIFTFVSVPYEYYMSDDWATAAAETTGWTCEMRFKVGTDNPNDYHLNMEIVSVEDNPEAKKHIIMIKPAEISLYGKGTISTIDMTSDFHTLRIAQEANNSVYEFWVDGEHAGSFTGALSQSASRFYWGALSGSDHGTIYIDYIRFTGAGAYLPGPANPKATNPLPVDTATDIAVDAILGWDNVPGASSHDIYLGTDEIDVADADRNSVLYKGNIPTTATNPDSYDPSGLAYGTTYYWRIDGVDELDAAQWPGDVWSFTTVDPPITNPTNPSPADGVNGVDVNTTLTWTNGELAASHDIYVGTDLTEVANADRTSSLYKGNKPVAEPSSYDPDLGYGATYYWRIDAVNDSGVPEWSGDVWSFTTEKTQFPLTGDLNGDQIVDAIDLGIFCEQWLNGPGCPTPDCADFDGLNGVDMVDYAVLGENWKVDAPPVITLLGEAVVTVVYGSVYTDAGATANDVIDGDLTSSIVVYNPVDTNVTGEYTITYNVTDSADNAAEEVTRTVHVMNDTTAPVITILGSNPVTVEAGSTYIDTGATACDDVDGDITGDIIVVNSVDTSVAGIYTVTYNVSDSAGNDADEVVRTVNVTTLAPVNIQDDFDSAEDNYDPRSESSPINTYTTGLTSDEITFNHFGASTDTSTGSGKSFYIEADIHDIAADKRWYYYFDLPLPAGVTNLHGKLSLSMDIKMNADTINLARISIDDYAAPLKSEVVDGVSLYSSDADKWTKLEFEDMSSTFGVDNASHFVGDAYDIELDDIGRQLRHIIIKASGTGPKTIKVYIDNYSLTGTEMDPEEWDNVYIANYTYPAWTAYRARVGADIDQRESELAALTPLPALPGSPSDKQDYQYNKLGYYKAVAADNIDTMNTANNQSSGQSSYFQASVMEQTVEYITRYQSTVGPLTDSINSPSADFNIYKVPAMEFGYLDGYTFPAEYEELTSYSLRMARGEYASIAMLLDPAPGYSGTLTFENTDFTDGTNSFSAGNLDKYIAKIWYQAGRDNTVRVNYTTGGQYFLTQELLLKNENLVRVTHDPDERYGTVYGENELWVTDTDGSNGRYINISTFSNATDTTFPDPFTISFNDSETLQPFTLNTTYKLLWSIVHIPEGTPTGTYTSTLEIKQGSTVIKSIPLTVEVLPFDLAESRLDYGLYYHGKLRADKAESNIVPLSCHEKTSAQQRIELQDMFDHGVLYPSSYEDDQRVVDDTLAIRNDIGFPQNRFYSGLTLKLTMTGSNIDIWQDIMTDYGYEPTALYIYGREEAGSEELADLIEVTEDVVYARGAKVYTALYQNAFDVIGDYMDVAIYAGGIHAHNIDEQIANWHSAGQDIFAYGDPQVGVENPEVYRRNYGIAMYQKGFDGAFDYAYQKEYGIYWNDFDAKPAEINHREEAFTYPTTNGIVGTIEWEGYRAAIDDVRYLSTLSTSETQWTPMAKMLLLLMPGLRQLIHHQISMMSEMQSSIRLSR